MMGSQRGWGRLLFPIAVLSTGAFGIEPDKEESVSLKKYLLTGVFEGVHLDGPTPKDSLGGPVARSYSTLKSTGQKATLRFYERKGGVGNPGTYSLTLGKSRFEGEWNITESLVHLWIDKVDGRSAKPEKEPLEVFFRAPSFAGDPFVIVDFAGTDKKRKVRGVLLMRIREQTARANWKNAGVVAVKWK